MPHFPLRSRLDIVLRMTPISGKIVGYDPGGNDRHGVAALIVNHGQPVSLSFTSVRNAEAALQWFTAGGIPLAAGIHSPDFATPPRYNCLCPSRHIERHC